MRLEGQRYVQNRRWRAVKRPARGGVLLAALGALALFGALFAGSYAGASIDPSKKETSAAAASPAPSVKALEDALAGPPLPASPEVAPLTHEQRPEAPPAVLPAVDEAFGGLELVEKAQLGADGRYRVELPDGRKLLLSLDAKLQRKLEKLLRDYRVPYGVSVAIEPSTGRVLAIAEHSTEEPEHAAGLAAKALAPAASIFKIVTAAALLENGISPDHEVCYHGGKSRLRPQLLIDSARDHRCMGLGEALGRSANVIFAKLAQRYLTPGMLLSVAERLLFNSKIALGGEALPGSQAIIPEEPFRFAKTAAGFNTDVRLTPLHGALLAAAIGNDGVAVAPRLVDEIDGVSVDPGEPGRRLLDPAIARELSEMMELTVSSGTARRAFRERHRPVLPGVAVAGKTGSLAERSPYRDHTWFVGYAPADKPVIAVATVIVNGLKWRVRAPYVARETLRIYLQEEAKREKERARTAALSSATAASNGG